MLALADLHAGCRQQDQSLEEHARWAASIHNLPKTFPGLMSFPVITVIEEVETPEESEPSNASAATGIGSKW
jgi:hypothetical protein